MAGYSTSNGHRCMPYRFFLCCVLLIFLVWGCGSGSSEQGTSGSQASASTETGSASFAIQWHTTSAERASSMIRQALNNCGGGEVDSITCEVYDESQNHIASGGPWNCSDHQGSIDMIPAGSNRIFAVLGWSGAEGTGDTVYQGQAAGITINPGVTVDTGTIDAYPFVPQLASPHDGTSVPVNSGLTWDSVTNAYQYRVQVSEDRSFATQIINQLTNNPTYTPLSLAPSTTYYWRVTALDTYGNEGAVSAQWRFTTTKEVNHPPTATINAPETGSSYTLGQTVSFEGAGEDPEDGTLSGNSLVWSSSIDGAIGTGTSFATPSLSAGNHTITLTVTDSDGATDDVTLSITVIAPSQPPVATITAPSDNSTFTQGDLVSFRGTGQDPEDGSLSGSSLVWTSSINGRIGTGASFGTQSLSVGNHTITLTVTDSDGATDSDTIRIVISHVIDVNIDYDFEYIPEGFPMGLSSGDTYAQGLGGKPYEKIKEPYYPAYYNMHYGYLVLGNDADNWISFILVQYRDLDAYILIVDKNNNNDLTDDGDPYANEGTGVFAATIDLNIDVLSGGVWISRPYRIWFWIDSQMNPRFYARCHYRGQLVVGGTSFTAVAFEASNHDLLYQESGLYIDLNADGSLDAESENFVDGEQLTVNGINCILQLNYP